MRGEQLADKKVKVADMVADGGGGGGSGGGSGGIDEADEGEESNKVMSIITGVNNKSLDHTNRYARTILKFKTFSLFSISPYARSARK